jgi:uncharacterized protein YcnI
MYVQSNIIMHATSIHLSLLSTQITMSVHPIMVAVSRFVTTMRAPSHVTADQASQEVGGFVMTLMNVPWGLTTVTRPVPTLRGALPAPVVMDLI